MNSPAAQDAVIGVGHYLGNSNMFGGMAASRLQSPYFIPLVLDEHDAPFHVSQDDAERQHQCAADPKVQAAVAKLIAGALSPIRSRTQFSRVYSYPSSYFNLGSTQLYDHILVGLSEFHTGHDLRIVN
jgi:hypothetical protein